ncbi:MAG: thiamine pyrophosphate-dependent dehydrogenase E1 component subunit alpha [Spirochaetales bacterium]|nr:thiamine pyrophosphate-dependent dehydrogenase E1 component subunit alpha [Spirochaetales bacterium]
MKESLYKELYEGLLEIRLFEQWLEEMFRRGALRGTTHGCIGQELIPLSVSRALDLEKDFVTGTHRSHGQYLAFTRDLEGLAYEICGHPRGVNGGNGGSQHLCATNFLTNGVTGGMIPTAVGVAFGKKQVGEGIVVAYLGDGGMNEGYVMESLNLASIFSVPILFVLENNQFAMSTHFSMTSGGAFAERIQGMGLSYACLSHEPPETYVQTVAEHIQQIRRTRQPLFLECHTFRFCGHSKSDKMSYIPVEQRKKLLQLDPLIFLEKHLDLGLCTEIREKIQDKLDSIAQSLERENHA